MRPTRGFTLIEMIMAMVVLAFITLGIGTYLQLGAQGYTDTIHRERLQAEARFVIERLTREIRHAAPNSLSFSKGCLSFYPVYLVAAYRSEPDMSGLHVLVPPDAQQIALWNRELKDYRAAAGFTGAGEYQAADDDSMVITGTSKQPTLADPTATLQLSQWLGDRSPGKRLYLFSRRVAFCQEGERLIRRVNQGAGEELTDKLNRFDVALSGSGLNSNGLIHLEMTFADPVSRESSEYTQSVQVINVL
ncbi:type II secretion system GspH family protein [Photobacterium sp. CCB-ST2H9]|uniref:PilW family protein n=1 Tax=Photobacterium sp. CCB-ST2H9 TaxID=2912855 RepID=UPI002003A0D1|nr:type II secretion system protein [Photobacterium sp. CCB-ST2H9]UTM57646.1 type II secretion system GspH family protein [Photobacterium sp. CCB-ST2H9]